MFNLRTWQRPKPRSTKTRSSNRSSLVQTYLVTHLKAPTNRCARMRPNRERRKSINQEHMKEFGGRYASEGDGLGVSHGTSGASQPDLCVIPKRIIDWTECLRDKRDISRGWTGHVHGMVAVQKWGCSTEFLYVNWLKFSLPN